MGMGDVGVRVTHLNCDVEDEDGRGLAEKVG